MSAQSKAAGQPSAEPNLVLAACLIEDVQSLIHSIWMAAHQLDRDDHAAQQDAFKVLAHIAGERLNDVEVAIERARRAIGGSS